MALGMIFWGHGAQSVWGLALIGYYYIAFNIAHKHCLERL